MAQIDINKIHQQFRKHYSENLEENVSALKNISQALGDIIDSLAEAKIEVPSWKYHLQTLISKILFTSNSIIKLCDGYELQSLNQPEMKVNIVDYQSIFILCRALIENYVTLCYIYNNNLAEEEKLFRYKIWAVSGLITRQNFNVAKSKTNQVKKEEEAILIEKILTEIKQTKEFISLDKNKLRKLRTFGLPRIESWQNLIDESNLNPKLFKSIYSYFSNYSHSEYISILQIGQSNLNAKNSGNISQVMLALSVVRIINALSIKFYSSSFKPAENIYVAFQDTLRVAIDIWAKIGDKNTTPNSNALRQAGFSANIKH
ncbi:MAG: hypothetical protein HGB12_12915 [Bacteroidetes bacterium]|nr:hypothetical protein [Bacteroidota bacterium]